MADINEIIDKGAIEGIKAADKAITQFDDSVLVSIQKIKELNETISQNSKSFKIFAQAQKLSIIEAQNLQIELKKSVKAQQETEKANKKVADSDARLAAREKEHNEILKKTVTTRGEAKRQNKELNIEIDRLTSAYGKQSKEVAELNKRIDQNTQFIRTNSSTSGKQAMNVGNYASVWDKAKFVMASAAAAMGLLSGAIAFGKGIIESTGATAKEFKAITTGLSWAWDEFKKSLATSDFSNLLTNMFDAIDAGRQYVNMLSDVKKSTRALNITNSELNIKFQEQKVIERDVSKTKEDRIAAGKKALQIEQQMADGQLMVADKAMKAELLHLRTITKLNDEQIKGAVSTYNSNKKNIDLANQYNKAVGELKYAESSGNASSMYGQSSGVVSKETIKIIKSASPEIKQLAGVMKAMGKTTGDELDELATKWVEYNNIQSESVQRTARVKITLGRLEKGIIDDGIKEEEKKTKAAEKLPTEYEKAVKKVTDIREKMQQFKIDNPFLDFPAEMATSFKNASAKVYVIEEAIKELTTTTEEFKMDWKSLENELDIEQVKDLKEEFASLSDEIFKTAEGLTGDEWEASKKQFEDEQQRIKDLKEAKLEAAQIVSDTVFNIFKDRNAAEFDAQLSALDKEKEKKLSAANLTEKQKAKIESDYAKKTAKLKEEQFKKEKAASIIQAIINTALSVTKAAPNPAQMLLAGLVGAAQIAVIAAQPIPEFDKGAAYTPHTFIAGEKRPEWMRMPSGQWRFVDRPTMFKNLRGATVVSGEQTERLRKAGIRPDSTDIRPELNRLREDVVNTIRGKKELHISASGSKITEREGNYNKEYFNRHVKWAGKN